MKAHRIPHERRCAVNKLTDYVKTAEAAEILGVSQNTLRKWAANGAIPMHRNPANGYRLFKRADLEKFLKKTARPVSPR
jgi:excisionase family DNA binding protein